MKKNNYLREKSEEFSSNDEFEYISSTIRKMAKSQGFPRIVIYLDEEQICIMEVVMSKTEKFSRVIRLMELVEKIQKDILVGYKCEMDLWKTKSNDPLFTFEFYQSLSSTSTPTYDYDDDFPY